jgi:putative hydrolase of the HAD superfamily
VLFDAGGVLLMPDPAAMRRAFARFGVAPDDEQCRVLHYRAMHDVDRLGRADWHEVDRMLARRAGVPDDRLEEVIPFLDDVYLVEPWTAVPGAAEVLLELQRRGVALGIVSNAEGTVEQQLAEHRICSVGGGEVAEVAVVIDSHVVGVEKPDPAIFGLALDALGIDAHDCLYVGDTVHFDVQGARAAGLHPVHLDPYALCDRDDHPHVAALEGLLELVSATPASPSRGRSRTSG